MPTSPPANLIPEHTRGLYSSHITKWPSPRHPAAWASACQATAWSCGSPKRLQDAASRVTCTCACTCACTCNMCMLTCCPHVEPGLAVDVGGELEYRVSAPFHRRHALTVDLHRRGREGVGSDAVYATVTLLCGRCGYTGALGRTLCTLLCVWAVWVGACAYAKCSGGGSHGGLKGGVGVAHLKALLDVPRVLKREVFPHRPLRPPCAGL